MKPGWVSEKSCFCCDSVFVFVWLAGKDLNQGYLNYVEPDTASSTSEITEMLDETPGLERVRECVRTYSRLIPDF